MNKGKLQSIVGYPGNYKVVIWEGDQALKFLEGRDPRLSNFLGAHCNYTVSLDVGTSFYLNPTI